MDLSRIGSDRPRCGPGWTARDAPKPSDLARARPDLPRGCLDPQGDGQCGLELPQLLSPQFLLRLLARSGWLLPGAYEWAFYAHILSGPVSLILGTILVGERLRTRFPIWHRYLGRIQVACVLLLVTPSGLGMAYFAAAGPIAAVGLAALTIATATCVSLGARSAMARRFADHRRWMWRCYLLLCSAVVLRLIGGTATITGMATPWLDPLATWMSWLVPLSAFELREWTRRRPGLFNLDRPRVRSVQSP